MRMSRKRPRENTTTEQAASAFSFFNNNSNAIQALCLLTLCQVVLSAYHFRNVCKTSKAFSFGSSSASPRFASNGAAAVAQTPLNSALHVSFAASASQPTTPKESIAIDSTETTHSNSLNSDDAASNVLPEWNSLSDAAQTELKQILNWKKVSTFDYPEIFRLDELTQGHSLLFMSWAILASPHSQPTILSSSTASTSPAESCCNLLDTLGIAPTTFVNFARTIEQGYKNNPYHNHIHAADVLQTLHSLLQTEHATLFRSQLTPIQQISILLAAILHDVAHDGTNNEFQVQKQSLLAIHYQNVSVLEQYHVDVGLRELDAIGLLDNLPLDQQEEIRNKIARAILQTDMAKHQDQVKRANGNQTDDDWERAMYLLHLCDISNPTKSLSKVWAERVLEEFYQVGQLQKSMGLPVSPTCLQENRVSTQQGFLKHLVLPAFEAVKFSNPKIMEGLHANFEYWMQQEVPKDEEDCGAECDVLIERRPKPSSDND